MITDSKAGPSDEVTMAGQAAAGGWRRPGAGRPVPAPDIGVTWVGGGLLVLFGLLLPLGNSYEVVVALLGLCWLFWRLPFPWQVPLAPQARQAEKLFAVVFGLIWGPMLLSSLLTGFDGTVHLGWLLPYGRFGLAGLGLIVVMQQPAVRRLIGPVALGLLLAWSLSALLQEALGWSFGRRVAPGMAPGVFESRLRLGYSLVLALPLGVGWALRCDQTRLFGRWRLPGGGVCWRVLGSGAWLVALLALLVSGQRSCQVSALLISALLLVLLWRERRLGWTWLLAGLVVVVGSVGMVWAVNPGVRARVSYSLVFLDRGGAAMNDVLSGRLSVWSTAQRMFQAYPVLGVGPSHFREAYVDYAAEDDWVLTVQGAPYAFHPHQTQIEVLVETGIVGFSGFIVAMGLLLGHRMHRSGAERQAGATATVLLLGLLWPVNSHPALFGSFFGLLFWLVVALYLAWTIHGVAPVAPGCRSAVGAGYTPPDVA